MPLPDSPREPARQRAYVRLQAQIGRLEDTITYFHNAINELRRRVSTVEKELERLRH